MPPRTPFRFAFRPALDMSPSACAERLESYRRDPQCLISRAQIERDARVVEAAREEAGRGRS
jgi:hypothetical protein